MSNLFPFNSAICAKIFYKFWEDNLSVILTPIVNLVDSEQ